MNILVRTSGGHIVVRPDTSWERDSEDLYVPGFVNELSWTPVLATRIVKPGRSVNARFANRYYDTEGVGAGILLYPEDLLNAGCEEAFAMASCLDHTSFIPMPGRNAGTIGVFEVNCLKSDSGQITLGTFHFESEETEKMIEDAIEQATRMCYIRTGDLLCIEIGPRQCFARRIDSNLEIKANLDGDCILDFRIIF